MISKSMMLGLLCLTMMATIAGAAAGGPNWTIFASKQGWNTYQNQISPARLTKYMNDNPNAIIHRSCPTCWESHKNIYYKRLTPVPSQAEYDATPYVRNFVDMFTANWMDKPGNVMGVNFKLYSSYQDAKLDKDPWTYCNHDKGVGFPRDCGPHGWTGWNWGSINGGKDFVFSVDGVPEVLVAEPSKWSVVAEKKHGRSYVPEGMGGKLLVHHLKNTNGIIRRKCPTCTNNDHKDIYYKRITPYPEPKDFDGTVPTNFLDFFTKHWFSAPKNELNKDFKLYSTYEDAILDNSAWKFCNYNDRNVGFPRDCGPEKFSPGQWISFNRWSRDFEFLVEGDLPAPEALPNALPAYNQWDDVASSANNVRSVEINDDMLRAHMATTNGIIRRLCPGCGNWAHKEIYYKRITPLPDKSDFDGKIPRDFLDLFLNNWFSTPKNQLNVDFELYSTYVDARTGQNRWTFCNYNDRTVGFPRDCGPYHAIGHGWTTMSKSWTRDFTFQVEGSLEKVVQAATAPAFTKWSDIAKQAGNSKEIFTIDSVLVKHLAATNGIIRRDCPNCVQTHQKIYYRRLTPVASQQDYDNAGKASGFIDQLVNNWFDYPKNKMDIDFALFSTYEDALRGMNAWTFCNYNDNGVGFPRDCGPNGWVGWTWNSFVRNSGRDFTFSVEGTLPPLPPVPTLPAMGGWTGVAQKNLGIPYQCLDDAQFRAQIEATNGIVRRLCPQCPPSHREIYYKRISPLPAQSEFAGQTANDFLDLFLNNWMQAPKNVLNRDFELYSTYEEARQGRMKWTFCNYDDGGVGFPRDCGPHGYVPHAWTSTTRRSHDFTFEVEGVIAGEVECKPPPKACTATGWGDPHMITFDGMHYDAHAIGEVIMMMSLDSKLMVQARLEKVEGHGADPAATTGVAIKENPKVDGTEYPLVQVSMNSDDNAPTTLFGCPVQLYVNETLQPDLNAGYNANEVEVQVHSNTGRIVINYPDLHLSLRVLKFMGMCHFTVTYALLNDCRPNERIIGLLGSPDDNVLNDWMTRTGEVLTIPSGSGSFFFEPAYNYTTQNWCIYKPDESIFTYQPGYKFSDYENCGVEYNPELERSLEDATDAQKDLCGEGDTACLMEAVNLGDGAAEQAGETPGADEDEPEEIKILKTEASAIELDDQFEFQVPNEAPEGSSCPVCRAVGWGDPHIITFDGVTYDVHVKGELTFLKSLDPNSDFTIQARTVAVQNHPKGPAVTSGVVVHETGQPTVQISLGETPTSEKATMFGNCPVQLFVNGEARNIMDGTGQSAATVQVKGKRIVVEYVNTKMRLDLRVRVWRDECHFSVLYHLADCRCDETLVGILGQPDGKWNNDWHDKNGNAVTIPRSRRERRGGEAYKYSRRWCISASESKFTYEPNMSHDTFDECSDSKGGETNYNINFEKLIEDTKKDFPAIITKCTDDNGEVDDGCVLDCTILGPEACDDFVKQTKAVPIVTIPDDPKTSGNENTGDAGSQGDPHFRTWTNEHFEYHGQCDLMLAKDPNFAGGLGIEVEIRTKLVRFWSYIKSAAIRIGDDILEVQGNAFPEDGVAEYWMNLEYQAPISTLGGFPVTLTYRSHKKRYFTIDLSSKFPGQKIKITTYREFVKVDFLNASEDSFGNAVGMLGDFKTGKTLGRDGKELRDFYALGNQWQVRPDENMLFHRAEDPQFPKACVVPEDPQGERRRRLDEQSITEEKAEAACAGLKDPLDRKDCVYDILATQDLDMAGAF